MKLILFLTLFSYSLLPQLFGEEKEYIFQLNAEGRPKVEKPAKIKLSGNNLSIETTGGTSEPIIFLGQYLDSDRFILTTEGHEKNKGHIKIKLFGSGKLGAELSGTANFILNNNPAFSATFSFSPKSP